MTNVEPSYAPPSWGALVPRLVALAAGLFVVATNAFVIAGLLPGIAASLSVHTSEVSYAITAYAAVVAIVSPVVPLVFSRTSRTTLMVVGLLLAAVGTVVAALAPSLGVFILGRVISAFGGAALVPTATAAAASLAPPNRRGSAIGLVVAGFTASAAFGAPGGTALAAASDWRVSLLVVAALGVVVAGILAVAVRRVPIDPPVPMRRRIAVLADHRLIVALLATIAGVLAFNMVYIFSSQVVAPATGGDGSLLAGLLLAFGVAGLIGNTLGGWIADRFGNRVAMIVFPILHVAALVALAVFAADYLATVVVFIVWGFAANAQQPAIQHRQATIDPATAGIALSWNSTALYVAIALAPLAGAGISHLGGAGIVPIGGAVVALLGLLVFQLGYVVRGRGREAAAASA